MTKNLKICLIFLLLAILNLSSFLTSASHFDHLYYVGDQVPLFVNKVGPLNNPSETYQYYELPFCHSEVVKKKESLGEVLNGDRLTNSLYEFKFRDNKIEEVLCKKKLGKDEVAQFRDAVVREFYFQMHCDDLPFWGFVGKAEESWISDKKEEKFYLFKHVRFDVLYNGNRIIEVCAFSDPNDVLDITDDVEINVKFTYSVFWNETSTNFENRMDRYSRASLQPTQQKIHWVSYINLIVLLVILIGLLMILYIRHLKNDLRRSSNVDEEEDKEVGWKYIHGDVFRCPQQMPLFCAVLGSGTQLLAMICFLFTLSFVGILYPYNSGALSTSLVIIYTLTSAVAGCGAVTFYGLFLEAGWEKYVFLAGVLFLGPVLIMLFILNTIAVYFGVTAALPFGTMVVVFLVYTLVGIPLLAFGGLVGYRYRFKFQAPSSTKRCPREIPLLAWYRRLPSQMFLGGLLPFSAIFLELDNFYLSTWGYKIYTSPGILFITFIFLILLTAILNVCLTYFQLAVEDHEWWWRSTLRGGSTALFMFVYCIYFYAKSSMSGFLQLVFFFGYNACLCYAFFLMLGTVSFLASFAFVRHIHHAVKGE